MDVYRTGGKHERSTSRPSAAKETAMPERTSCGRSTAGVELTEDVLDQMTDAAEAGLDITSSGGALAVRPGGRLPPSRSPFGSNPSSAELLTSVPPQTARQLRRSCARRS